MKWMRPTLTPSRQAGCLFTYPGEIEGWVTHPSSRHLPRWPYRESNSIPFDREYDILLLRHLVLCFWPICDFNCAIKSITFGHRAFALGPDVLEPVTGQFSRSVASAAVTVSVVQKPYSTVREIQTSVFSSTEMLYDIALCKFNVDININFSSWIWLM